MSNPGTMLECDICLKRFPDAALLSVHQWVHAGPSSNPPRATVNVLCEPDPYIKPEEVKEEISEQEDENTDKNIIAVKVNDDNNHQELIKWEDIKVDAADPLMISDQKLLGDSVNCPAGKYLENLQFIDTRMSALTQHHSRKAEQQIAPRPEGI